MLQQLQADLTPLTRHTPPVPDVPREYARFANWVEPVLVGEVVFRNWTPDNRLRHPAWRGLRPDRSLQSARRTPNPPPTSPNEVVEGAFQTPDGRWRVEVIRRGRDHYYRLINGDNMIDGLFIDTVEQLLAKADINMADLVAKDAPAAHKSTSPGAA